MRTKSRLTQKKKQKNFMVATEKGKIIMKCKVKLKVVGYYEVYVDADSPGEAEHIAIYDKFAEAHFGELEDADCFVEYVEDEDGERYF